MQVICVQNIFFFNHDLRHTTMQNEEALLLKNQICHRLYLASNGIIRRYKPYLDELSLTYPQYLVMLALWEQDEIKVHQIIQKTAMDAGALTLILKKLVTKDYITIVKDEKDQRQRIVTLTEAGKTLKTQALAIPPQILCQFSDIPNEELQQLMALLDKLNAHFC